MLNSVVNDMKSAFCQRVYFLFLSAMFCLALPSNAFAIMQGNQWHPGIGDPTVAGWVTVLAYFSAMVVAANKAITLKKLGEGTRFWLCVALFLLLLGINKQLDLQTWFTQTLRAFAREHGWYQDRRIWQSLFILTLLVSVLISLMTLRRFLADSWHRHKVTWVGIELLCAFVLIRAASFHHMDLFINHHWLGMRFNFLLENAAILVIMYGVYVERKQRKIFKQIAQVNPR